MKMSFSNTFGSNLSFKADVLKALGGFRSEMGYSTNNEEYRFVKSLFTNFWKKFEQKDGRNDLRQNLWLHSGRCYLCLFSLLPRVWVHTIRLNNWGR